MNFRRVFYGDGVTPLASNVIIPTCLLLIFGYMNLTMPFSFMPQLFKSFGDSEVTTGYHVAIAGSVLFIGRLFGSLFWGEMADRYGRKNIVLVCGIFTCLSTLAFGFTSSFEWAVITRILQGFSLGIYVSAKSLVMQYTDDTNSSYAVSTMSATFFFALIFGSVIGGFLSFPDEKYPNLFSKESIFGRFGILFPNMLVAIGCFLSVVIFWKYMPSSNKDIRICDIVDKKKAETDKNCHEKEFRTLTSMFKEINLIKALRNKHCVFMCLLFGVTNFICFPIEEIYPLYAATARSYYGFGFTTSQTATSLLIVAVISLIAQLFISPRIIVWLGLRKAYIVSCLLQVCLFPLLPLLQFIEETESVIFWILLISTTSFLRVMIMICQVGSLILIENSVHPSLSGAANGIGMFCNTVGRVTGISIFASIYAWSLTNVTDVKENYRPLGFPFDIYFVFYLLSIGSFINALFGYLVPVSLEKKLKAKEYCTYDEKPS